MKKNPSKSTLLIFLSLSLSSCAINFELTSQRTALENQILGTYEEIDSELYMISSVRGIEDSSSSKNNRVKFSRQNQIFNRDDIDELKSDQILGETYEGTIMVLPSGKGLVSQATKKKLSLARILVKEENRDRTVIWKNTIEENQNLTMSDMGKVRETYALQIFEKAKAGHWFRRKAEGWIQKTASVK